MSALQKDSYGSIGQIWPLIGWLVVDFVAPAAVVAAVSGFEEGR